MSNNDVTARLRVLSAVLLRLAARGRVGALLLLLHRLLAHPALLRARLLSGNFRRSRLSENEEKKEKCEKQIARSSHQERTFPETIAAALERTFPN
jgi:hypothetical protein